MKIPENYNLPDISTVKQVADFLQVHETTIRRAIKAGELAGMKIGNTWRIERSHVQNWLRKKTINN